jgi:hypothetical protein
MLERETLERAEIEVIVAAGKPGGVSGLVAVES